MDFNAKIEEYKEKETISSPIWIWFERNSEKKTKRNVSFVKKNIHCKFCSTLGLITHLKNPHGSLTKYNAEKIFKELSDLKSAWLGQVTDFFFQNHL